MRRAAVALAAALAALPLGACKERGTAHIHVTAPECTPAPTEFNAYAIAERSCELDCACGDCFALCDADPSCALACGPGFCPIGDLDRVTLDPAMSGPYAVVFEFYAPAEGTARTLVGYACANVFLDADGTSDLDVTAQGMCCL